MKIKHKPIHSSWKKAAESKCLSSADQYFYFKGANAFRTQSLKALDAFTAMTNEPPVVYNNKVYVSHDDVIALIEGLYANVIKTKIKDNE